MIDHMTARAIGFTLAIAFAVSPATAAAQTRGQQGSGQPADGRVHDVRRLNTPYRFTPPVRTEEALKRTMSRANTQRDVQPFWLRRD
jgi:hypothetical protein